MKKLLLAALLVVGAGRAWTQIPGRINALRRPGETMLFSFKTASGKTMVLCEGAKGAYLVYRFGTATNVELQYPTMLTATSWKKFTYYPYHRSATPQAERYFLSFSSGGNEYQLFDRTEQERVAGGDDDYVRYVGVSVTLPKGEVITIRGKQTSVQGDLTLSDEYRARVKQFGDE
jgi:hypothetical protein